MTGATVGEVLTADRPLSELKKNLFNDEGKLRSFVNVYLNDEDIRYLDKDATKPRDDTISIVPSIAGGATAVAEAAPALSKEEILRYSRHLIMPEVGMEGQLKLKKARVLWSARAAWARRSACIWRRRASDGSGWWISTSSIPRICSGR